MKENELINDIKEHFGSLMNARSLAVSNDKKILEFLLESSNFIAEYKERFFEAQCGALIFKKDDFLSFLDLKLLSASYTSFSNKIGLGTSEKKFLKNNENVVLNYPFKDCILKGGQKSDDEKNTEIFFNNILAKSEIDVLFAPKVLNAFELLGGGSLENALKNKPNLLIKGNNLIALHTLKEHFKRAPQSERVKLIYIDPPYNTGNDSFNYNDRFNHSTWLTFMKNRLEIARELLRDDGVIFVQCDDNEQAYLKVLMDEIFGRENFVSNAVVIINRGGRDYGGIAKTHEYILCYSKTPDTELNMIEEKDKKFAFTDENGGFNLMELRNRNILFNDKNRPNLCYPFYLNPEKKDENGLFELSLEKRDKFIEVYPLKSQGVQTVWRWGKEKAQTFLNTELKGKEKQDGGYMIVQKYRSSLKRQRSVFDEKEFVNERGTEHIKELFNEKAFGYPKSEYLLQRIIEISTNENDLVLDFFAGSGTTLAVAHKMKRRYIGIEQMDYIQTITKERLKKVIEGESGGISKAVEWNGGGALVYCELASLNSSFIEKIENSHNENELNEIYKDLQKLAFIDYRVDIQSDLNDLEFQSLGFEEKKRVLKKCLDRNMDYIPYADIEDSEYKIDEQTRILNDIFYKGGDDE